MEHLREQFYNLYIREGKTYAQVAEILNLKYKQVEY